MSADAIKSRLEQLRAAMQREDIAIWVALSADPHLSEYLPDYWQTRAWLSGFTGSAGTLVVGPNFAALWTDSRYWVQAEHQLQGTGIALFKMTAESPSLWAWCGDKLKAGEALGLDGNTLAYSYYQALWKESQKREMKLNLTTDLVASIWEGRPALPQKPVYSHPSRFVALQSGAKIGEVQKKMKEYGADYHLISAVDEIAWLTNLRGSDVNYNPVFLAHLLLTQKGAQLFIHPQKINTEIGAYLATIGVEILPYAKLNEGLADLAPGRLLIDGAKVTYGALAALPPGVELLEATNPATLLKSRKAPMEIDCVREAMRQDGAALCEFLLWLDTAVAEKKKISELDIDKELTARRAAQDNFVSLSFNTIAGFNANAALPHYAATPESFSYIEGDGVLLIDSGAQYYNGTTDITRVIAINHPSIEQKRDFTLVLKAHIALATLIYPAGIKMPLLDAVARAPLWKEGYDFGHGTGHGVGYFLNVHEGPQVLSYHAPVIEKTRVYPGMITSNEPGLYREGKWGIRIENLMASIPHSFPADDAMGEFLEFSTLTLCPIDLRLVESSLLTQAEKNWLNNYHREVREELSPRLTPAAQTWLEAATKAI